MRIDVYYKDWKAGTKVINEFNHRLFVGDWFNYDVNELVHELSLLTECRVFIDGKEVDKDTDFGSYGWRLQDCWPGIKTVELDDETWYTTTTVPVVDSYIHY